MNIEEIVQKVKDGLEDDVLCVAYTGSTIFCTNCKDVDLFVITSGTGGRKYLTNYSEFRDLGIDVFAWSYDYIEKAMSYKRSDVMCLYLLGLTDKHIVYGTNPLPEFNLLDHKTELVDLMIGLCKQKYCNNQYSNMKDRSACLRQTYWLFANYFALVNNSLDFTDEQLEILQKCHDNELPRTYAEDLYQKLLEMRTATSTD